jgi:hypothetical protein
VTTAQAPPATAHREAEPGVHRLRTRATAAETLGALGEVVEAWGGEWRAATRELEVPLQAGVRHGWLRGRADAAAQIGGSELVLHTEEPRWALDRSAVLMLLLAAASGLCCVLWPFYPPLGRFVPIGLVLGASVWLVVLSRLRNRGIAELLEEVEEALADEATTLSRT